MSILFYRRPDYVHKAKGPLNKTECQRIVEKTTKSKRGLPEELSFENVMANRALPPCTLRDFMDYLVYVSHDAENLQFYLWLQDYTQRFNALKPERKALAPEWIEVEQPAEEKAAQIAAVAPAGGRKKHKPGPLVPKIDFDKPADPAAIGLSEMIVSPTSEQLTSPTKTLTTEDTLSPARSTFSDMTRIPSTSEKATTAHAVLSDDSVRDITSDANALAGLKWQGFSVQPLRPEITRAIAHYLAPSSPRELNLSSRDRATVLHALQHTTHPSALAPVAAMVEATLRGQAHPNFIRWSICNGNKPRIFYVRTMGLAHIFLALLLALLLILSRAPRWWRFFAAPILFLGATTMIAAYKGLCVILHRGHKRTLKPWESEDSVNAAIAGPSAARANDPQYQSGGPAAPHRAGEWEYDEEATLRGSSSGGSSVSKPRPVSLDSFGSANNFESESWVGSYKKKSLKAKIWDAETWVQEESVRLIQDRIVKGAQVWSAIVTVVVMVVVVAVPGAGLF